LSSQRIIVTDLDGTLLDRDTYSYAEARRALYDAVYRRVPVVLCSSKTRAEQVVYREKLGIHDPFIVEDGGAIFVEREYFTTDYTFHRTVGELHAIELGTPYETIRQELEGVRAQTGIPMRGYGDMAPEDVARASGLDTDAAALALKREYQETIVSSHGPGQIEQLRGALSGRGLRLSRGGRFIAVSGPHDKGAAVAVLTAIYRQEFGEVETVGIGDSHNDASMLAAVDVPVLVQKSPGTWESIDVPGLRRVEGVGPEGWNRFVLDYLANGD
jgi:mannosyl-3-phosphoglycerate phosphatase